MQIERGRVAVVTGAASGIGYAMAEAAVQAGMSAVIADVQSDALDTAAQRLRAHGTGADVVPLLCDVGDAAQIARLANTAFELGSVQLICSNAGIIAPGYAWTISPSDWQRVIDVNLMATIRIVHEFFPRLIEAAQPAHLLVTGSMASVTARPGISPYVTAKHGLLGFCEALRPELTAAGTPIGVTLLMPGQVITGMNSGAEAPPTAITSEQAAKVAFEAVARDQLFAFTQADRIPEVQRRFDAIVAQRTPASPA